MNKRTVKLLRKHHARSGMAGWYSRFLKRHWNRTPRPERASERKFIAGQDTSIIPF